MFLPDPGGHLPGGPPDRPPEPPSKPGHSITKLFTTSFTFPPDPGGPLPEGPKPDPNYIVPRFEIPQPAELQARIIPEIHTAAT